MPRKKVIIIKPFIFTCQYMLPGNVRHEIRPIRMRYLQSDFCARKEPFSEVYMVKVSVYFKLVLVISTLYRRGKLLEHLIVVTLPLNILFSWAFETSLNCSVMGTPPLWFECYFRQTEQHVQDKQVKGWSLPAK